MANNPRKRYSPGVSPPHYTSPGTPTVASLDVVVGDRWLQDAERLEVGDAARWVGAYDGDVLVAPVDVVVDGVNLTADLHDEPVFAFVEGWAAAMERLAAGGTRARVECAESPLEMCLERDGAHLRFSVFELGSPGTFRLERIRVDAEAVLRSVRALAVRLDAAARARKLRVAARAEALLARLPMQLGEGPRLPISGDGVSVETRASCGISIVTHFVPGSTGLDVARGALRFDRHLLLARGHVLLQDGQGRRAVLAGRPLRLIEELVDGLGPAVRRGPLGRGTYPLCATDGGSVELRVADRSRARVSVLGGGHVAEFDAEPADLVRLVLDHASALVETLLRLNANLAANALLSELGDVAESLRGQLAGWEQAPAAGASDEPAPGATPAPPRKDLSGYEFSADRIRLMRYERSWSHTRSGAEQRTLRPVAAGTFALADDRGVDVLRAEDGEVLRRIRRRATQQAFHVRDALVFVDESSVEFAALVGKEAWRLTTKRAREVVAADSDADLVMTGGRDGACTTFERTTGDLRWEHRSSGAITGVAAGAGTLVASSASGLFGLDAETGKLAWQVAVPYERMAFRRVGEHIIVVADEPLAESTFVGVLNASSGAWMRRHVVAADVASVGWTPGVGVAVVVSGAAGGQVIAASARSGGDWVTPLDGPLGKGRPRCRLDGSGHAVIVATGRRVLSATAEGVTWSWRGDAHPDASAFALARRNASEGLIFVASGDGIQVLEASKGRPLCTVSAFWEELGALAADERGNLVVLEVVPGGRSRVHGVCAVGLIATLDGGRAAG